MEERIKETILNASLFWKAFVANSLIILIGGTAAVLVARDLIQPSAIQEATVYIVAAVTISLFANYVVLRVAFLPLQALRNTVLAFLRGDLTVRAERSVIGAPQVNDLADILNVILDKLQDYTGTIEAKNEQLRRLSAQVITAQEEERRRISRELHDEASQNLTSLMLGYKMLESSKDLEEVRDRVADLKIITGQAMDEIRKLAWELRPTALDDLGLAPALRGYVKEFERQMPAAIKFKVVGVKDRLAPELETVLYRAVQEALTNVARHSQANSVDVSLVQQDRVVVATVQDNGAGFNAGEVLDGTGDQRGMGLIGMRERAALVGGQVEIESKPGSGTRITVTVPLEFNGEDHGED
ncbi:MAG: sensor histidine kinase [Chloroflexi bacterium]|nr:sensor histidine kinase [Chloroflexota bacterium]